VEEIAGGEPQHRVAQELEALVGLTRALPGHVQVGAVRERQLEQPGITEGDAVLAAEVRHRSGLHVAELGAGGPAADRRGRRLGREQALEPAEERETLGRGRRPWATPAAAAAARAPAAAF